MNSNLSVPSWAWVMLLLVVCTVFAVVIRSLIKNKGIRQNLFSAPYTLWMVLFTIVPCILIGYFAFTDGNGAFTLDNFKSFWNSNYKMQETLRQVGGDELAATVVRGSVNIDTLIYSLWMALLCTLICLILGYPAAIFMADREMKLGATLVVLFVIPMWMNFLLRTIGWLTLLEDNGVINTLLEKIGLPKTRLLYNEPAVLLGMVYNFLPFMVFPIYTSLNKMDPKLGEAAQDLGCNHWQTLFRVTMPLSIPGVISGITMVFMPSVTTFFIPRVLGGGHTQMFGDLIESTFLTAGDWNLGSALSLVMMILILISLSILRKSDPNGEGGGII